MKRVIIQGYGYWVTHLAYVPESAVRQQVLVSYGQVAVCGVTVRTKREGRYSVVTDDGYLECSKCTRILAAKRAKETGAAL